MMLTFVLAAIITNILTLVIMLRLSVTCMNTENMTQISTDMWPLQINDEVDNGNKEML